MSGSGSSSPQQSYQQTQSSNEPPAYIKSMLQGGATDLNNLYMSRGGAGGAPEYYPGTTVAPFSTQTQGALNAQTARATNGSPLTGAAQNQLTKTMRGDYLDPNTNPYFTDALKASFAPQTENFMSNVLPGINATFGGAGRTSSGLHQDSVDRAVTSLNRSQSDATAKAGADVYTLERQNIIDGMKFAPTLANQDYFDINQLGVVGSAYDDQAQRNIDADVAKYDYNANKDWNYISQYLARLNSGYPGGTSTGSSMGLIPQQQRDSFSSIFGAGTSLAGLGLGAYTAFSDERLKENIAPIGKADNGTPLYLYNYKGETTPRVGPMAQEVAETNPDAVHMDPSGFLKVDYGKALGLF